MSSTSVNTERLRILLACARPLAARILELRIQFRGDDGQPDGEAVTAVTSLLTDKLKLALLGRNVEREWKNGQKRPRN